MKCIQCGKQKLDDGYVACDPCRDKQKKWYYDNHERECEKNRVHNQERRADPDLKERERLRNVARRLNNPERFMWERAKRRAAKSGIPFDIEIEDVFIPERCPVFGTPFRYGEGATLPESPSLDRIIPRLGYVKGNVAVISHRANAIKNNATSEELQTVARWVAKATEE